MPSAPRLVLIALALLTLAGGALRAATAADATEHTLSADERAYARLAIDLSTNGRYGGPESEMRRPLHWPPGAPAMFAVAHKLDANPELPAAYWLQALCGTLVIPVTFLLALLLAGRIAGLVAAAIVAFYAPQIALAGTLLSEGLGTLLIVAAVLATVWAYQQAMWWRFALAGAVFGLAILTRADMALAPLLIALVLALARRRAGAAILVAATALVLAPWVINASSRADGFVLVTQGDAATLFIGTYLPGDGRTGMKDVLGPAIQADMPQYRDRWVRLIPASVVLDRVAQRHPELEREAALRAEARRNIRRYALGDPLPFAGMMVEKVARMWFISSRVGSPTAAFTTRAWHGILVGAAILLSIAALIWTRGRRLELLLVLSLPVYSSLLHSLVVSKPRYNLPLIPLLAAAGAAAAILLFRRHRAQHVDARGP
jgi:4-amino-4-deoxy-L-arabinose transferase-like glycosyltransferase